MLIIEMRNFIHIQNPDYRFRYLIDYNRGTNNKGISGDGIKWYLDINSKCIRLYKDDVQFYRNVNDWYDVKKITNWQSSHIAESTKLSKITVYVPNYSVSTCNKGIKYMITINTWINGIKLDLGSYMFKPTDTYASPKGLIKNGNQEFSECIDFDIIDPFDLIYSNNWAEFRQKVCKEGAGINTAASYLNVSLFVVDEYEERYMISNEWICGCTCFDTSNLDNHMSLDLSINDEPLGFCFTVKMNNVYNDLIEYLAETYFYSSLTHSDPSNLPFTQNDIRFELIIKNKDSVIVGPKMMYYNNNNFESEYGKFTQLMKYDNFGEYRKTSIEVYDDKINRSGIEVFFKDWNEFEEGWSLIGSMTIYHKDDQNEMLNIISNEIPITQEVFSKFVNGGTEKIIDIDDMITVNNYNIVNKIENKIVKLDRQSESKHNILQPVFFTAHKLESLVLHPYVTETISINLDRYKSKVDRFVLQINDQHFEQIGSNSYGILFKIPANTLSSLNISGIYYILNENLELITTGKYTIAI